MKRTTVVDGRKYIFDVYIGRPGPWGNPFSYLPHARGAVLVTSRDQAIARYEAWLLGQPQLVAKVRRELAGKILGCFCAPLPCHGNVLARIANGEHPAVRR
jgi:hypothetical protein